jgi:hypothetical protein
MADESSGSTAARTEGQRFALPDNDIAPGRSQPKRVPPPRRDGNPHLIRRIAWGVATFAVSLAVATAFYRLSVSPAFGNVCLENGSTAAIALLIGCFSLSSAQRLGLEPRQHLFVSLAVLAITPWSYQLGNRLVDTGTDLATGFNFVFEILLAAVLYRLASRYVRGL